MPIKIKLQKKETIPSPESEAGRKLCESIFDINQDMYNLGIAQGKLDGFTECLHVIEDDIFADVFQFQDSFKKKQAFASLRLKTMTTEFKAKMDKANDK